ncbi:MAG: hypothetical protein GWP11_07475 [Proteobacteria bacterium]|nr:hypothetical protein [Pseudomonadota bacterium]
MRLKQPVLLTFFFILATIPLIFGARHPLVHGLYSFCLLIAGGIWLVRNFAENKKRLFSFNNLAPLAIIIFIVVSALPLPLSLVRLLSPVRAENLAAASRIAQLHDLVTSLSYYAPGSMFYAIYGLALFFFFLAFSTLLRSDENRRITLWIITIVGVFEAAYGLLQATNPALGVLWLPSDISSRGCARGTIIYRNQYAAFLNMCWPMAFVLGISLYKPVLAKLEFLRKQKKKLSIADRIEFLFHKATVPFWSSAFMILALIFSRSRGGIVVMLILVGLLVFLLPFSRRSKILSIGLLSLFIFVYGGMIGFQVVTNRFMFFYNSALFRFHLWFVSLAMLKDHIVTGIGMGSYQFLSPVYLKDVPDRVWFDHAHNEYVEMAIELGLPAMLLFMVWLVRGMTGYWRQIMQNRKIATEGRSVQIVAIGAFCGISGFLLHATVDFIWRLPANVIYAVALLALLNAASEQKKSYKFTSTSSSPLLASSHPPRIDSEAQTNESKALVNCYKKSGKDKNREGLD